MKHPKPPKVWRPLTDEEFRQMFSPFERRPMPATQGQAKSEPLPEVSREYAERLQRWIEGGCVGDRPSQ